MTAENIAIQTTTAEESGTVTGEQVRELALNNRNFEQLILLQPGVANQLAGQGRLRFSEQYFNFE